MLPEGSLRCLQESATIPCRDPTEPNLYTVFSLRLYQVLSNGALPWGLLALKFSPMHKKLRSSFYLLDQRRELKLFL